MEVTDMKMGGFLEAQKSSIEALSSSQRPDPKPANESTRESLI